jgi:hypothetical protein
LAPKKTTLGGGTNQSAVPPAFMMSDSFLEDGGRCPPFYEAGHVKSQTLLDVLFFLLPAADAFNLLFELWR